MNTQQQEPMKRGEFLRSLGLSSAALMSFYCLGTMTSCSKGGSDDPAPAPTGAGFSGNAETAKGAINFTLDLTSSDYAKLKTVGQYVSVGDIVVANANGTMVALGRICTHQGGSLEYRASQNDFQCNVHQGLYNTNGTVKKDPPTQPVKAYKTALTNNNNTLTVTA
jgi:cytochrome b6-f complex iron-sulfur subunit